MISKGKMKTIIWFYITLLLVINVIQVNSTSLTPRTSINTKDVFNLNSANVEFTNGSTLLIEANTTYSFNLLDNVQIDLLSASKSINVTLFEYENNPLNDAGLIEYTLHSKFISLNSSLPAWDSIIIANISKTLSDEETSNLAIGIEKVFFVSYDLGAQTYEAPDGKDRLSNGNIAKTRINNLDRVFVLAEITEGSSNSASGFYFVLVPISIISFITIRKKRA